MNCCPDAAAAAVDVQPCLVSLAAHPCTCMPPPRQQQPYAASREIIREQKKFHPIFPNFYPKFVEMREQNIKLLILTVKLSLHEIIVQINATHL